jgi:hypothetical protein
MGMQKSHTVDYSVDLYPPSPSSSHLTFLYMLRPLCLNLEAFVFSGTVKRASFVGMTVLWQLVFISRLITLGELAHSGYISCSRSSFVR